MIGEKSTDLTIVTPDQVGISSAILAAGGTVTGLAVDVGNFSYLTAFCVLNNTGAPVLTGLKIIMDGLTLGLVYASATLLDIRDLSAWFSGCDVYNFANWDAAATATFQVGWSKTGTNTLSIHGGQPRVIQSRSWKTIRLRVLGFGGVQSAVTVFLQGY